jgi:hypothetical protein
MKLIIKERNPIPAHSFTGISGRSGVTPQSKHVRDGDGSVAINHDRGGVAGMEEYSLEECKCSCPKCGMGDHDFHSEYEEPEEITNIPPEVLAGLLQGNDSIYIIIDEEMLEEAKKKKKGKGDRCVRIAKRKYHKWPSAYASGAVVKCRQGKIWKGLKESATEIVEYEIYEATLEEAYNLSEKYKADFSLEKSQGLHGWFKRNKGKGWIDCKTGKPCGRSKAGRGAKRKYPACRPTKAQCNKSGTRRKKSGKAISWKPKKDK